MLVRQEIRAAATAAWLYQVTRTIICLLAAAMTVTAAEEGFRLGGGLRVVGVHPGTRTTFTETGFPPLEGPLVYLAVTVTDERQNALEWVATAHTGVDGSPLPGRTQESLPAFLDSGAVTHLLGFPDAVAMGVQGSQLTGYTFPVSGAGGSIDLDISKPMGFFVQGLQSLDAAGHIQTNLMVGQGNFEVGVNTEANHLDGNEVPTVIGAPLLAHFAAVVRNSARVRPIFDGEIVSTPSVEFFYDPEDISIPQLAHRIYLQSPFVLSSDVEYMEYEFLELYLPSTISGAGSLFLTANQVTVTHGEFSTSGKMMVDSGAQATLINRFAALDLDLNTDAPDFEVDVQGIGGVTTAPGFIVDRLRLPADGGSVIWSNVPLIVLDVADPTGENTYLFGILGSNLLADRDWVFNGIAEPPYLDVTEPTIPPLMEIADVRPGTNGTLEVDWWNEPAPPRLVLQRCDDLLASPPQWSDVATGDLATIRGTFLLSNDVDRAFLRLTAP